MNEFSDVASEVMSSNTLNIIKATSTNLDYKHLNY